MSIYANAAQAGMSLAQLAMSGDNAQTKAAYNSSYAVTAGRLAMAEAKNTAESNISSLKQDKILSDTNLEVQQNHAEANAKLAAAVAGVSGQNVDNVIYSTQVNEVMQKQQMARQYEQQIEGQTTAVANADIGLNNIQDPVNDTIMQDLTRFAGSIERADFKRTAAIGGN